MKHYRVDGYLVDDWGYLVGECIDAVKEDGTDQEYISLSEEARRKEHFQRHLDALRGLNAGMEQVLKILTGDGK